MSGRYGQKRGRGRGRLAPGQRPVSEGSRIGIADQLADFQASDETGTEAAATPLQMNCPDFIDRL